MLNLLGWSCFSQNQTCPKQHNKCYNSKCCHFIKNDHWRCRNPIYRDGNVIFTNLKHGITIHEIVFHKDHSPMIMHWNPSAENSRGQLEYWRMLVLRPPPFAHSEFQRCTGLQRISCVSSRTGTEIHNVSRKSLPALRTDYGTQCYQKLR